jgi:hypothetical protein
MQLVNQVVGNLSTAPNESSIITIYSYLRSNSSQFLYLLGD